MAQQNQQNQQNQGNQQNQPGRPSTTSTPSREGMNKPPERDSSMSQRGFDASQGLGNDTQADGTTDGLDVSGRPVEVNAGRSAAGGSKGSGGATSHDMSDEESDESDKGMPYKGTPSRKDSTSHEDSSCA
jgi:hypothetical protein